ncbi:MAG TPA: hypothetical protein PLI13_07090, partial [Paracoccus sp. (in: a-proteobacteria)]|nr:hypothetical protein [Paracoccus sp. (in: a-proteobacteria)]
MTDISELNTRGLVLIGCGRMGGALLDGWLKNGLAPGAVRAARQAGYRVARNAIASATQAIVTTSDDCRS